MEFRVELYARSRRDARVERLSIRELSRRWPCGAIETKASQPRRVTNGVDASRVAMLLAVLGRRARMRFGDRDVYVYVYVSTVGGVKPTEPAADLAIALALVSAIQEKPLPHALAEFGEISLAARFARCRGRSSRPRRHAGSASAGRWAPPSVRWAPLFLLRSGHRSDREQELPLTDSASRHTSRVEPALGLRIHLSRQRSTRCCLDVDAQMVGILGADDVRVHARMRVGEPQQEAGRGFTVFE